MFQGPSVIHFGSTSLVDVRRYVEGERGEDLGAVAGPLLWKVMQQRYFAVKEICVLL